MRLSARDRANRSDAAPRLVAGAIFVAAIVAVAAIAAWPIYRSGWFLLLVAVASVLAGGIAVVAQVRRWSPWATAAAVAVAFILAGVPLAVPSRLGGAPELLRGLADLGAGLVFAWKDLVTVDLPVGTYRNLLVPALVVFLVGTCAMLVLAWREDRIAYAAAPIALGMVSFGLFFGRTETSADLALGPVRLPAPVETAVGASALVITLLWLAWRSRDERVRALRRAAASSGVRMSRRPTGADRRRAALGAAMLALAVIAGVAIVPFAARGAERDVLRSAFGPSIDLAAEVSPLAAYRASFADARVDQVLFTVDTQAGSPDRVRIATLDGYDGQVFRAGGAAAEADARFVRVPSTLDAGEGEQVRARVSIDALEGIWMPTLGRVESVRFAGDRASALADSFYYSAETAAGVETAGEGLRAGDVYVVQAAQPALPDVASLTAPGGVDPAVRAPGSLREWVQTHQTGTDGAALAGLVALLRDRGYLSHGLVSEGETPRWAELLGDYVPQPSASGHSLARIDALFTKLLERETDPRAEASGNYVAAIGDDEQFAVAAALIARELGFPSRVVVGARLHAADPDLAACDDGVCRAGDLSAWAEVQGDAGVWVPLDATPQREESPSLEVTEQRDPEVVTEVRPDSVEEVLPPDPVQEDSGADDDAGDQTGLDLAWLWPILRIAGIILAVLLLALGPFLVVILAKAARRKARRTRGTPSERIAGGWEEYVDASIDSGRGVPTAATRSEIAQSEPAGSGQVLVLAERADRAVFSGAATTSDEAEAFWRIVDEERRRVADRNGFWRRLVATVSLRSFIRPSAPKPGRRGRTAERGRRWSDRGPRTSP